jgi:flagellar biosynthetic protein FliR
MDAMLPLAWSFLLALTRTLAMVMVAPGLSSKMVPNRVKIGLAVAVTLAGFSGAPIRILAMPPHMYALAAGILQETMFGALAGIGARMVLEAAAGAGHVAGLSMGLGYGSLINPESGASSSVLSDLFSTITFSIAIALGMHREACAWLCRSFTLLPPGSDLPIRAIGVQALAHTVFGMGLAMRIAYPLLLAVTLGHVGLGLIGKFAQQLNLNTIGFSASILAGGGALYLFAPQAVDLVAREAIRALPQ